MTKDNRTIELRTVWVYEGYHALYAGIWKVVVSGPTPSEDEISYKAFGFNGPLDYDDKMRFDKTYVSQEEVLFIDGIPHFLHT